MSGWSAFMRFLKTDPQDAGCAETLELLHAYVERELTHGDAAQVYPRIAAHLEVCDPCAEDYAGLLAVAGGV